MGTFVGWKEVRAYMRYESIYEKLQPIQLKAAGKKEPGEKLGEHKVTAAQHQCACQETT